MWQRIIDRYVEKIDVDNINNKKDFDTQLIKTCQIIEANYKITNVSKLHSDVKHNINIKLLMLNKQTY